MVGGVDQSKASVGRYILSGLLLLVIAAAGLGAYFYALPREKASDADSPTVGSEEEKVMPEYEYRIIPVATERKTFQLQLADTPEKQSLGLGLRSSMGGDGMLFEYGKPQQLCFWMKDVKFAIDMIWLGADKQVLQVQSDVSPNSYPRTTYCQTDAQYVVELNAGEAQKHAIAVGSKLDFAL